MSSAHVPDPANRGPRRYLVAVYLVIGGVIAWALLTGSDGFIQRINDALATPTPSASASPSASATATP
ncbi:MAG: hypothetical protein RLZZ432_816 [Chloroflexota bacterium]|jgi:hypothetical protein